MEKKIQDTYVDYVLSLQDTGDMDAVMSYEEWLEAELAEMWEQHGAPYL